MAGEWTEVSLGQLFKVKHGFAFKGEFFTDEPKKTVLVTPGNFAIGGGFQDDKRKYYCGPVPDDYVLSPGQIVVTMTDLSKQSDTLGYAARIPADDNAWLHNQRVGLLVFSSEISTEPRFVEYLLRTHDYRSWVVGSATGTTVKHTSPSRIESFKVRVPPLDEQRAIAHILGTLDDKIELNRRMNETLAAMARAIFKSWFVDFDPVRAKASGEPPESICLRLGLAPELLELFPSELSESALGPIPCGWEVSSLGAHIEIFDSKRVPLSNREREQRRGAYPYYGAASVMDYVDDFLFDGIHVLMGEDGSVVKNDGKPVLQYVWGRFWVNNHAHVLVAKPPLTNEHLLLVLDETIIAPYVTGAVQAKLSQGNLRRIPFLYASAAINVAFGELLDPIFSSIRARAEENRTLMALRDSLLPRLISGEIPII